MESIARERKRKERVSLGDDEIYKIMPLNQKNAIREFFGFIISNTVPALNLTYMTNFYSLPVKANNNSGSTLLSTIRKPKCRLGPVTRPVLPMYPIT